MMSTTHPLAEHYLRRLEDSAGVLPRRERDELLAEIRSHLEAGIGPNATEADVRNLLDQLGSPDDIVAAAAPNRTVARRGAREAFAVVLLVTGFPPIIGWLVGVGLLLSSTLWTARQKLLGILVWPGGLLVVGFSVSLVSVGRGRSCPVPVGGPAGGPSNACTGSGTSPWAILAAIVIVVAPILVGMYLYRAAGRRAAR
jgi:uncharacterized membrane protein